MRAQLVEIDRAARDVAAAFADVAVASAAIDDRLDGREPTTAPLTWRERALCDRFRCARRRAEFVAGRIAAHAAVARILGSTGARPVEILKDAQGAPVVVGHPAVQVSISHSQRIALAVASRHPVGVDLEADEARPPSFARLFCSAGERAWLSGAEQESRQNLLNTLWTRKEAVCKVGRWAGTLAFAALDCVASTVRIEGRPIEVRSGGAAGYVLSIAAEGQGVRAHG